MQQIPADHSAIRVRCREFGTLAALDMTEEPAMPATTVRDETRRLAEQLPDDATWEDVLYQIYVRQSVEAGLEDARAGRLVSADEVRRRLGLPV